MAPADAAALFEQGAARSLHPSGRPNAFRGQMLTEMARMSLEDGMVMQIHAGSWRKPFPPGVSRPTGATRASTSRAAPIRGALKPLLDAVGMERGLTVILFTLDETTYGRELAPARGAYPGAATRPAMVGFRQLRGHPAIPAR